MNYGILNKNHKTIYEIRLDDRNLLRIRMSLNVNKGFKILELSFNKSKVHILTNLSCELYSNLSNQYFIYELKNRFKMI